MLTGDIAEVEAVGVMILFVFKVMEFTWRFPSSNMEQAGLDPKNN